MTVWLDGAFMPAEAARIDPADRGFLLGDGAFETMRFENGVIRRWPRHRARLALALATLAIAAPDWTAIHDAALQLAEREGLGAAALRLTVSRGAHGRGLDGPEGEPGMVLITAAPLPAPSPARLALIEAPRRDPGSLSARFKTTGSTDAIHARRLARGAGADMAVMLGAQGRVASADCANLFVIEGDRVITPDLASGALAGTTRAALVEAALAEGLDITVMSLRPERLAAAQAVFTTNALTGVRPALSLDGRQLDADHRMITRFCALEAELND